MDENGVEDVGWAQAVSVSTPLVAAISRCELALFGVLGNSRKGEYHVQGAVDSVKIVVPNCHVLVRLAPYPVQEDYLCLGVARPFFLQLAFSGLYLVVWPISATVTALG